MSAADLFKAIITAGWPGLLAWKNRQTESLHLECKAKDRTQSSGGRIFNDLDRDHLAKAISGLANTEGGVLVLGVHAKSQAGGPDVVQNIDPIENVRLCETEVSKRIIDIIEPQVSGIQCLTFP